MPIRHDPTQVFTTGKHPALKIKDYDWRYPLDDDGIGLRWTDWLKTNCESPWGWWFDTHGMCHVGFSNKEEMMRFVLTYQQC